MFLHHLMELYENFGESKDVIYDEVLKKKKIIFKFEQ